MSDRLPLPAFQWKYWEMAVYAEEDESDGEPGSPPPDQTEPRPDPVRRPRHSFESFLRLVEDRLNLGPNSETAQ